jgi:Subtilase family
VPDVMTPDWISAVTSAETQGDLVVMAAGNDNSAALDNLAQMHLSNVVIVGAVDDSDQLASFSNSGAGIVDLAAPGVGVIGTVAGGKSEAHSGTSVSAALVAGDAALAWGQHPTLTDGDIVTALFTGADSSQGLQDGVADGRVLDIAGTLAAAAQLDPTVAVTGSPVDQSMDSSAVVAIPSTTPPDSVVISSVTPSSGVVTSSPVDQSMGSSAVVATSTTTPADSVVVSSVSPLTPSSGAGIVDQAAPEVGAIIGSHYEAPSGTLVSATLVAGNVTVPLTDSDLAAALISGADHVQNLQNAVTEGLVLNMASTLAAAAQRDSSDAVPVAFATEIHGKVLTSDLAPVSLASSLAPWLEQAFNEANTPPYAMLPLNNEANLPELDPACLAALDQVSTTWLETPLHGGTQADRLVSGIGEFADGDAADDAFVSDPTSLSPVP